MPLPTRVDAKLREQLVRVKVVHDRDVAAGYGRVWLPYAYAKTWPQADRELGWQSLFRRRN